MKESPKFRNMNITKHCLTFSKRCKTARIMYQKTTKRLMGPYSDLIKTTVLPISLGKNNSNGENHTSSTSSMRVTSDFSHLLFKKVFSFLSSFTDFPI